MSVNILSARIKNFRSISVLDVKISKASVFVGSNDAGKSNVLRALNLFFNGETNPGTEFNFEDDYNFHTQKIRGKAREVAVTLEIGLPVSYHKTNGQVIIWSKKWREDGLWTEEYDYHGERIIIDTKGQEKREKVEISEKSNVHSLLRKVEFEYVPAVKNAEYFDDLRGRIYGIISGVASGAFHKSSTKFEKAIGEHVNSLTADIGESLGLQTRLALPRDLHQIFERLDFLSGYKSVSLNNRGDGIKARHIPLILKFMAKKKAELLKRGGAPISSIWAYEEPENNLELASAIQLADEMYDVAKSNTAQVIITTHSPAFYDLALKKDEVSLHYIKRASDETGTVIHKETSDIDKDIGTLALLGSRIPDLINKVRAEEAARHKAIELAENGRATIFVEGESDRLILERCLSIFFPHAKELVRFETKLSGGGDNYVIDMLSAWRSYHKHHKDKSRAVGILDGDARAKKSEFNSQENVVNSAKCFCYPKPAHILPAHRLGFDIPETLEVLYPVAVWNNATKFGGTLKDRTLGTILRPNLREAVLKGEKKLSDYHKESWWVFASKDFETGSKITTAQNLIKLSDDDAKEHFSEFESLLFDVLGYLGLQN